MTQTAVTQVHPFAVSSSRMTSVLPISVRVPVARYPMSIIGSTVSFAGKPKIKARRIMPSIPKSRAAGSRNPAQ